MFKHVFDFLLYNLAATTCWVCWLRLQGDLLYVINIRQTTNIKQAKNQRLIKIRW